MSDIPHSLSEVSTPTWVFVSSFAAAAFSGLAALLRSGNVITKMGALSALLNSGFLGLGISLLWYSYFKDNLFVLVGISVLAGLGGMTTVEFAMRLFRKFALAVRMGPDGKSDMAQTLDTDKEPRKE